MPYLCPAGYWTVGWGHLCKPDQPQISRMEGEIWLAKDLQTAYAATLSLCPNLLHESDSRVAAITDFTFNLGRGRLAASTLRRRILAGNWEAAKVELGRWIYGGGRILPGLVLRRAAEAQML